jgi:UDP-sugar transporter A1/2/3
MIKPQKNIYAWFSLLGLCIGLVVFNVPSNPQPGSGELVAAWYLAPVAGFAIACLSALASISSETTIKEGDFWESQAYLYAWGILFAAIAYPLTPSSGYHPEQVDVNATFGITTAIFVLVTITAGTGFVVAVVLRARDNILKVIGTAASLVTIAASQFVLLPELRASTFTPWKLYGGGLVTTATWCYNYYSQQPWPAQTEQFEASPEENVEEGVNHLPTAKQSVSEDEADKGSVASEEGERSIVDHTLRPNATKVVLCIIFTTFVTYEVASRQTD